MVLFQIEKYVTLWMFSYACRAPFTMTVKNVDKVGCVAARIRDDFLGKWVGLDRNMKFLILISWSVFYLFFFMSFRLSNVHDVGLHLFKSHKQLLHEFSLRDYNIWEDGTTLKLLVRNEARCTNPKETLAIKENCRFWDIKSAMPTFYSIPHHILEIIAQFSVSWLRVFEMSTTSNSSLNSFQFRSCSIMLP